MAVVVALVGVGAVTPYVLRRFGGRVTGRLVVVAHLAGMTLVWLGVIALAVGTAGLAHGFAEFCELALTDPPSVDPSPEVLGMVGVLGAMFGRGTVAAWRTGAATGRLRRRLSTGATRTTDGVTHVALGSVACTVGLLRPRIFVDRELFGQLDAAQRAAVLAHERAHVRGLHGLFDLLARCLAAGLAPLPGARLSVREVRRHLEALADDRAVAVTSRHTVAASIVAAATAATPRPAFGAAGWSAWRVERLLEPPSKHWSLGVPTAIVVLSIAALAQTVGHAAAGVHLFPVVFPAL